MLRTESRNPGDEEYRSRLHTSIARELHDGAIQSLTASVLRLEGFRDVSPEPAMQLAISEVETDVRSALSSLRRLIRELRAEAPREDLASTIRQIATRLEESSGLQITVVVSPSWPELVPSDTALNLERVAQEAVTNAIRHAQATDLLIELDCGDGFLTMKISDNGRGMPPHVRAGSGMLGMRERAALMGGRLRVRRRHLGTAVEVRIPAP